MLIYFDRPENMGYRQRFEQAHLIRHGILYNSSVSQNRNLPASTEFVGYFVYL